jgi:hypothetical protein
MAQISQIKQAQDPVSPRDVIAAILTQALPADDERRTFTVLYTAYFALSLTEPALAIGPLVKNSNAVTGVVASQPRAAQAVIDCHLDRLFPAPRRALPLSAATAGGKRRRYRAGSHLTAAWRVRDRPAARRGSGASRQAPSYRARL